MPARGENINARTKSGWQQRHTAKQTAGNNNANHAAVDDNNKEISHCKPIV